MLTEQLKEEHGLLSLPEAAKFTGLHSNTIARYEREDRFPKRIEVLGRRYFRKAELEAFALAQATATPDA